MHAGVLGETRDDAHLLVDAGPADAGTRQYSHQSRALRDRAPSTVSRALVLRRFMNTAVPGELLSARYISSCNVV